MRKIFVYFITILSIPAFTLYRLSSEKDKIRSDINVWISQNYPEHSSLPLFMKLHILLLNVKEFRNLFYLRTDRGTIIKIISKLVYRPLKSLYLNTKSMNIGGGLYIQHGFSTIIIAKSIGSNCWINQQVTIGWVDGRGCPEIGNNVFIHAGAVVVGDIKIGDNVVIGANTTVTKDVQANCTVVGSQSVIIKKNGVRVHENL